MPGAVKLRAGMTVAIGGPQKSVVFDVLSVSGGRVKVRERGLSGALPEYCGLWALLNEAKQGLVVFQRE